VVTRNGSCLSIKTLSGKQDLTVDACLFPGTTWAALAKPPAMLYNSFVLKETRNWIESSEYDLKTAEHMFSTDRY